MRGCHSLQGNCYRGLGPFLTYLSKSQYETPLGITVRVWARTLSPGSAGILPAQSPSVSGSLGFLVRGLSVCVYVLTLWISDSYFKDPGATCWLPNGRPGSCSCCNNLSLFCRMVPQQITKLLRGCVGFLLC